MNDENLLDAEKMFDLLRNFEWQMKKKSLFHALKKCYAFLDGIDDLLLLREWLSERNDTSIRNCIKLNRNLWKKEKHTWETLKTMEERKKKIIENPKLMMEFYMWSTLIKISIIVKMGCRHTTHTNFSFEQMQRLKIHEIVLNKTMNDERKEKTDHESLKNW